MILNLGLIIFFQPLTSSLFIFLAPILNYFLKDKTKDLILNLIFLSLITDIIFIKPLGFFFLITSLTFFLVSLIENFLGYNYFYQKLIYIFLINLIFLLLFFFFSFGKIFDLMLFLKFLIFNIIFQIIYLLFLGLIKV